MRKIIELLRNNPYLDNEEIAEALNLDKEEVRVKIRLLRNNEEVNEILDKAHEDYIEWVGLV